MPAKEQANLMPRARGMENTAISIDYLNAGVICGEDVQVEIQKCT
jgi:hypothetical protein